VYGKWGEGKTSVLRQAKSLIATARPDAVTVWFNAWQYDHEEHPLFPLALTLGEQLVSFSPAAASARGESLATAFRSLGTALLALAYGLKARLPGFELDFQKAFAAAAELGRDQQPSPLPASFYHTAFTEVQRLAAEARKLPGAPPIIVFVDDLDRCLPEQALRVLQSIRLALSQPGLVFVLGMHREPLERHLARRFGQLEMREPERSARAFLDKIIQLGLPIPRHARRFDGYIGRVLESGALGKNLEVAAALRALAPTIGRLLDANPRRFIRLTNNLIVDHALLRDDIGDLPDNWLGLCAVARLLRDEIGDRLFDELARDRETCEVLAAAKGGQVDEWETRKGASGDALPPRDELRRTLGRLAWFPSAQALITSDLGRQWLEGHEARERIEEFLMAERNEALPGASSPGIEAINLAIRRELGLSEGQSISDDVRRRVRGLDLSHAPLTDDDLQYLESLPMLVSVDLSGTQVTGAGPARLERLSSLATLRVSDTQVAGPGLAHLVSHIRHVRALVGLDLSGTPVSDDDLPHLGRLATLEALALSRTRIVGEGLLSLQSLASLAVLDLSSTQVTDRHVAHLEKLTSLRWLGLWKTKVTGTCLASLKSLEQLQVLGLSGTDVGDSELWALAQLEALETLELASTRVGNAGLAALASLRRLQRISLQGTHITDAGLASLARIPSLRRIDLQNTMVTDRGIRHLEGLASLVDLALWGTNVTEAGRQALQRALPKARLAWENPVLVVFPPPGLSWGSGD
jgi:hypothetical protein